MRGSSFDQEVALAQGVNVGRVFSLAWIIGGALASIAGILAATSFTGLSQSSYLIGLKALPVVVVGGLDSIGGAIVGALIIGTRRVVHLDVPGAIRCRGSVTTSPRSCPTS